MQNIKVSAIIPTYNRPETSLRAIKTVLAQTHPCDEILVVNDCSTDKTLEAIKDFQKTLLHSPIKILDLPKNLGVSGARNEGIRQAANPWLAFLDSDDEWVTTKLEKQLTQLKKSKLLISHTDESWVRNGKPVKKKSQHKKYGGMVYEHCIDMCFIGPSTAIIHKSIFEDIGFFDESFVVCEDYDLWLRLAPKYPVDYVDEELLIKHGGHEDQLSTSFHSMDYWRALALKKQTKNSLLSSESQQLTIDKLNEKIKILTAGCIKHKNTELLAKVKLLTP